MVFEEKHHMPWAYEAYEAYELHFRENGVNGFHRQKIPAGMYFLSMGICRDMRPAWATAGDWGQSHQQADAQVPCLRGTEGKGIGKFDHVQSIDRASEALKVCRP